MSSFDSWQFFRLQGGPDRAILLILNGHFHCQRKIFRLLQQTITKWTIIWLSHNFNGQHLLTLQIYTLDEGGRSYMSCGRYESPADGTVVVCSGGRNGTWQWNTKSWLYSHKTDERGRLWWSFQWFVNDYLITCVQHSQWFRTLVESAVCPSTLKPVPSF